METISVVISARNEEAMIGACIQSVTWADEIIVVENSSDDKTGIIAKRLGAKVFTQKNNPMLNVNKNYGFEKATSTWILSLDADERISESLAKEIKAAVKTATVSGYWIPRKNILFGKWIQHGLWWPDNQLRLFKRGHAKFPCLHVHEYLAVDGKTDYLREPMVHENYQSISQYLRKMDTLYTESEVQKLLAMNYQLAWYDAIRFPVSDFLKIYFAQGGYKDGLHGLVLSMLQGFYSFIVFAKLWERQAFAEREVTLTSVSQEMAKAGKDAYYWIATSHITESVSWPRTLYLKVKRKLVQHIF